MKHYCKIKIYSAVLLTLTIALTSLSTNKAQAAVLCVNQEGSGGCYATIQGAINAANEGDTINVAAGFYDEEDILITKGLTLLGAGEDSTIITPSQVTNKSIMVVQNPSGDVLISGFNFEPQPKTSPGAAAILVTGTAIDIDSATVTISNNVVSRSSVSTSWEMGFSGQHNHARVIIKNNRIFNSVSFEQQAGSTSVVDNRITIYTNPNHNPYQNIISNDLIVSTPQIVERNTFLLGSTGSSISEAITFRTTKLGVPNSAGTFTNLLVKDNTIHIEGPTTGAIGVTADSGTITGAIITGNEITVEEFKEESTFGVSLLGNINNSQITKNSINNVDIGLWFRPDSSTLCPSENTISKNQILDVVISIKNECTQTIDAVPNWFGSVSGPTPNMVFGSVNFSPWCANKACTDFYVAAGGLIQNAIDAANPGSTIFVGPGTYTETILIDKNDLTIQFKDHVVIEGENIDSGNNLDGSCFIIAADGILLRAEHPLGAVCKPTSSSFGIWVNADHEDIIINNLEFDGSSTNAENGIYFDGAIKDVVLTDLFIHGMLGGGILFSNQPEGYVEIKGNLFMDNSGYDVYAPGALDVNFNSWGNYHGPRLNGLPEGFAYEFWTHAGVHVNYVAKSSRFEDEIALGENPPESITYEVLADLKNAFGGQFTLTYNPTKLQVISTSTVDTVFPNLWVGEDGDEAVSSGVIYNNNTGKITFAGATMNEPINGENQFLFSITFKAVSPTSEENPLYFHPEDEARFSMNPKAQNPQFKSSSLSIYPAKMVGINHVNVYELPTLKLELAGASSWNNLVCVIGEPCEVNVIVANDDEHQSDWKRTYEALRVGLQTFDNAVVECLGSDEETWVPCLEPVLKGKLEAGEVTKISFRIFFTEEGEQTIAVNSLDGEILLVNKPFTFDVLGAHAIIGSVQMQGYIVRSGVLVQLTHVTFPEDYHYEMLSTSRISNNFGFKNVAVGIYSMTLSHKHYLTFSTIVNMNGDIQNWGHIELVGGDLLADMEINIRDASLVGTYYSTDNDVADTNFDGVVNILDLAMIGGNYGLQSHSSAAPNYAYIDF